MHLPVIKCHNCGQDCFPPGRARDGSESGAVDPVDYRWYCATHKKDVHHPRPLTEDDDGMPVTQAICRMIDREIINDLLVQAGGEPKYDVKAPVHPEK